MGRIEKFDSGAHAGHRVEAVRVTSTEVGDEVVWRCECDAEFTEVRAPGYNEEMQR